MLLIISFSHTRLVLYIMILAFFVIIIYLTRKCFQKFQDRQYFINIVVQLPYESDVELEVQEPSPNFNNRCFNPEIITSKISLVVIFMTFFASTPYYYIWYSYEETLSKNLENEFYFVFIETTPPFCLSFAVPLTLYINNSSLRKYFINNIKDICYRVTCT